MDERVLGAYLTSKFGEKIQVTGASQAFPGMSRETWLIDITRGGHAQGLVVRMDPPGGGLVPTPLKFEYDVFDRLSRTPVPVAPVYWYDEAPEISDGRPLFVRARVEGVTYPSGLQDDTDAAAERRKRVVLEYVEKISIVHKLDWKSCDFGEIMPAPASPEAAAISELQRWTSLWRETRSDPFPVFTEALYWLAEHAPPRAMSVSLCKGQTGIGEEIWRDDKIVALSDWELAHIGDPLNDLAQSQGMLNMWDREKILRHYEACTGFTVPRENMAFFTVLGLFVSALVLNQGLPGFNAGVNKRLARATLGLGKVKIYEHMFGAMIEMDLEVAAAFVHANRPNPYHNKKVSGS
jgi:aminoglycoside phosphotransferase (APT) family kinase protein